MKIYTYTNGSFSRGNFYYKTFLFCATLFFNSATLPLFWAFMEVFDILLCLDRIFI